MSSQFVFVLGFLAGFSTCLYISTQYIKRYWKLRIAVSEKHLDEVMRKIKNGEL